MALSAATSSRSWARTAAWRERRQNFRRFPLVPAGGALECAALAGDRQRERSPLRVPNVRQGGLLFSMLDRLPRKWIMGWRTWAARRRVAGRMAGGGEQVAD